MSSNTTSTSGKKIGGRPLGLQQYNIFDDDDSTMEDSSEEKGLDNINEGVCVFDWNSNDLVSIDDD